jgi:Tfp pilus assembly protein PilN
MIRINLLGQPRPKAKRRAVPPGAALPLISLALGLAIGGGVEFWDWFDTGKRLDAQKKELERLKTEQARLNRVKVDVAEFEKQKAIRKQRIDIIHELERNKTGGQELLEKLAGTVVRTESLWLTSLNRKGNTLSIEGTAGSMNGVANFITQLKQSDYFDKIEIKESKQDERSQTVPAFQFSLTADFTLPAGKAQPAGSPGKS